MNFIRLLVISHFITFSFLCAHSQTINILKGRILDQETSLAIPHASIRLAGGSSAAIANSEGNFTLNIENATESDSVILSSIGYTPLKLAIKSINQKRPNSFSLIKNTIQLHEVIVKPSTAISILKEAVKNSQQAYASPSILKGFYREFVKRDSLITRYADGLVNYYVKKKRNHEPEVEVEVEQSRAKEVALTEDDDKYDSFNSMISINRLGEFASPVVGALDSNNFAHYSYTTEETSYNEKEIYVISFEPTQGSKEALNKGKIYIDKENMLIMGFDYHIAPISQNYTKSISLLGITMNLYSRTISVRYQLTESRYSLAYIYANIGIKLSSKKSVNQITSFKSEFQVNKVLTDAEVVPPKDLYHKRSLYKNGNQYTNKYWENSNITPNTVEESEFINKNN